MTKSKFIYKLSVGIVLISMLSSCALLPARLNRAYQKKSVAEQEIAKLNARHAIEIVEAEGKVSAQKNSVIAIQDGQLQTGTHSLYGADLAFKYYVAPEPGRVSLIINNRVTEAASATGKSPTAAAMKIENDRLLIELDETKTSLEDLATEHKRIIGINISLANEAAALKLKLADLEKTVRDINENYASELIKKQQDLIVKQDKVNALEKERGDDAEWIRKMKLKAMAVCGLLALVCVAGSIWSPIGRENFVIGAATFGLASAAIFYIQAWMVGVAVGVVILLIIGKLTMDHFAVTKTATGAINFIQDVKDTNPAAIDKQKLADYMGKYTTDATGKTVVVPDTSVEKVINSTLRAGSKL